MRNWRDERKPGFKNLGTATTFPGFLTGKPGNVVAVPRFYFGSNLSAAELMQ
jgi:hypothetical protein